MSSQWMEMLKDIINPDRETHAIPSMDGPMRPNAALDDCPIVLSPPAVTRPEDICADGVGGFLISDGEKLVRFDPARPGEVTAVEQFDAPISAIASLPGGGVAVGLDGDGQGQSQGLRIVGGPHDGKVLDTADGKAIGCTTALLALEDQVYIAQGSTLHTAADWVWDLMEKNACGRVLRWDLSSGQTEVICDGLAYPHGLAPAGDGNGLVVSESWAHRLLRLPLRGRATPEVLIPNYPGYPSRLIANPDGGYWLTFFAMRTELLEFVLKEDDFRQEMMETVAPAFWIRPTLEPNRHYQEPLQGGGFRVLGIIKPWAPPRSYGLIVELDNRFRVVRSLHSRADGGNHGVTAVAGAGGALYAAAKGSGRVLQIEGDGA